MDAKTRKEVGAHRLSHYNSGFISCTAALLNKHLDQKQQGGLGFSSDFCERP